MRKLFRERLAALASDIDAGYGFDLVRLSVTEVAPFLSEQADFSGETGMEHEEDIAMLADRVRARLGQGAFLRPVQRESHLPENASLTLPYAMVIPPQPAGNVERLQETFPPSDRPIRLFDKPEPIEVTASEVPEGAPYQFRWRRIMHRVARSEGPERIAPEWWLKAIPDIDPKQGETPEEARERSAVIESVRLTRDYFRVEDGSGRRYWLYRQGLYGTTEVTPQWFMQGLFA